MNHDLGFAIIAIILFVFFLALAARQAKMIRRIRFRIDALEIQTNTLRVVSEQRGKTIAKMRDRLSDLGGAVKDARHAKTVATPAAGERLPIRPTTPDSSPIDPTSDDAPAPAVPVDGVVQPIEGGQRVTFMARATYDLRVTLPRQYAKEEAEGAATQVILALIGHELTVGECTGTVVAINDWTPYRG